MLKVRVLALVGGLSLGHLALPGEGHAYSVDNHARLTDLAIDLVLACRARPGSGAGQPTAAPGLEQCRKVIKEYNVGQDDPTNKLRLWHFHDDGRLTASESKRCAPGFPYDFICWFDHASTFDAWTDYLWQQVEKPAPASVVYPALGATLHFIQDMAVPTHAVPVFHPDRGSLTDAFDDHEFAVDLQDLDTYCAQINDASSVPALLDAAQQDTRDSLNAAIPGAAAAKPATWALFWRADRRNEDDPRFGSYGCSDDFGSTQPIRCAGQEYRIAGDAYRDFASSRARKAVLWSAATIVLFERQLRGRDTSCAGPDEDRWYPSKKLLGL